MEMTEVKSSNIKAAGFDSQARVIRVRFSNGTEYDYHNATQGTFDDFLAAKSQGKYFHQHIKGKLTSTKVEKDDDNGEF